MQAASILVPERATLRRWLSRAFIVSILAYLVIVGYLVAEAVMGASKWAPYGVNVPAFVALIIASELIITVTAALVFREDEGIWPVEIAQGWAQVRGGSRLRGLGRMAAGAWDIPLVDLRLRSRRAIYLGRCNRLAALAPLVYALAASAGGAPWGLRTSAFVDIGITLAVWAFMELVMVQPQAAAATAAAGVAVAPRAGVKRSVYEVRRVQPDDLDRIEELERIKWKAQAASREMVQARLRAFPQGQFAAVHISEVDGVPARRALVAWATVMATDESRVRSFRTWDEVTSNGTIADCDPEGEIIIGVNLTSATEGATFMLMGEILAHVVEWGKTKLVGGARLNGFATFNKRREGTGLRPLTADEYVALRELRGYRLNEERIDAGQPPLTDEAYVARVAELRAAQGQPAPTEDERPDYVCSNVRGYLGIPGAYVVRVVPNYFADEASDNYGVVMEWVNPIPRPLRRLPLLRTFVADRFRAEVRKEWEQRRQRVRELSARRQAERVPAYLRRGTEPAVAEETAAAEETAPGRR